MIQSQVGKCLDEKTKHLDLSNSGIGKYILRRFLLLLNFFLFFSNKQTNKYYLLFPNLSSSLGVYQE